MHEDTITHQPLNDHEDQDSRRQKAAVTIQRAWRRYLKAGTLKKSNTGMDWGRAVAAKSQLQVAEELSKKMVDAFRVPETPDLKFTQTLQMPKTFEELADSRGLSFIVFSCVLLNGIQMGVQADHESETLNSIYFLLDNIFTGVFAVEMFIKLVAWRKEYFKSAWNIFDFSLTWLSIIDVWFLSNLLGDGSGMKMLAVLRILRIFRVVRLLRMVRSLRELALIVQGFIEALQTTCWVSLLLLLLLYIFSIFCVDAIGKADVYPAYSKDVVYEFNNFQYFGTIPRAMFTLLNLVMMADDWSVVSRAILEKQPIILALMIFFVLLTTIGLLNVVAAILVEHILCSTDVLNKDDDNMNRKELLGRLESLYAFVVSLDQDGDCTIDDEELEAAWDNPQMQELKAFVSLPLGAASQDLSYLLDADGNGSLEMKEFVKGLVRLLTNSMWQHILEVKLSIHRILSEVKAAQETQKASSVQQEKKEEKKEENKQGIKESKFRLLETRLCTVESDMQDIKSALSTLLHKQEQLSTTCRSAGIVEIADGADTRANRTQTNGFPGACSMAGCHSRI